MLVMCSHYFFSVLINFLEILLHNSFIKIIFFAIMDLTDLASCHLYEL
jgi:hypothetical protein